MVATNQNLAHLALLRLPQIIGDKKKGIPPLIPVSRSMWSAGVKSGKFPKPIKLSSRCTVWWVREIAALADPPYPSRTRPRRKPSGACSSCSRWLCLIPEGALYYKSYPTGMVAH